MYIPELINKIYHKDEVFIGREWNYIAAIQAITCNIDYRLILVYRTTCPTFAHFIIKYHNYNRLLGVIIS